MSYSNITNPSNFQLQAFGQKGLRNIASGFTPVADEFYRAFTPIEDAVVTATAATNVVNGDSLTSVAIPAGVTIYGLFSAISVASGRVIAYIA